MNRTMVDNIMSPVGGVRRRGNVMLFVIFILGTLFAASMAFLALMRTEAGVMTSRRNQAKLDVILGGLSDDLLLGVADSLMGRGVIITGLDGDPCVGNDEILAGQIPYVEAVIDCDGPDGDPTIPDPDGLADNPDMLAPYAMIPGVHPLLSSIEPYSSGLTGTPSLDLEYFAASDLHRAWNGHADVRTGTGGPGDIQPTVPAGHPLRIRALDEGAPGNAGPFSYRYDQTDDARATFHGSLADADGDGVVDSYRYRIARLGDGDTDWFNPDPGAPGDDGTPAGPDFYSPLATDDSAFPAGILCDGTIDTANPALFKGAPSFTGGPPTPLPCDDFDGNGILDFGTAYPQYFRRAIAAKLRDQDENVVDDLDDLYFSLRLIQNGGMANLGYSHRALIDNLFGKFGSGPNDLTAANMMNLPYGPAVEQALRRRGVLAPFRSNDPLTVLGPLGEDMLANGGRQGPLYNTVFGALVNQQGGPLGQLQWFPVLDEPGGIGIPEDIFDNDWAGRWMNPDRWNDLNDSAGLGNVQRNYGIAQIVTNVSIDDLLMRNGKFGAGLLTGAMPQYDPTIIDGWVDAGGAPYSLSTDTAIQMYPAYDVNHNPATGVGDPSFIDPTTGLPKVPLPVMNAAFGYGRPRDAGGTPSSDVRYAGMQFALHSIGNINALTQREVQTVQDYFTVMLRNVKNYVALGLDPSTATPADLINAIHNQAAQLTANFIDFADFHLDYPGGGAVNSGQPSDVPTAITSRSSVIPAPVFYGIEKQPYISEVYWDNGSDQLAIELTNPHNVPIDLAPGVASGTPTPYSLRLVDGTSTTLLLDQPFGPDGFAANGLNIIAAGRQRYVANNDYNGLPAGGRSADDLVNVPESLPSGGKIQLVRILPGGIVICDQFAIPDWFNDGISNRQRDNNPANVGGWRVTVPFPMTVPDQGLQHTLGTMNNMVTLQGVAPVHAATDDMGLESAYPTTGAMLLLMRNANSLAAAANATLGGTAAILDNGHMPVFDTAQVAQKDWAGVPGAQPLDGTTMLSIPWGQLVFDYFTALPFDNQFDPLADPPLFAAPQEPGNGPDGGAVPGDDFDDDGVPWEIDFGYQGFTAYLRANQPTVELGGVRVHGRININAAPWKVLDGLPLMHPQVMPVYKHLFFGPTGTPVDTWTWRNVLPYFNGSFPGPLGFNSFTPTGDGAGTAGPVVEQLGVDKAKGIVAYRELRDITDQSIPWTTGNYNTLNTGFRMREDTSGLSWGGTNILPDVTQRHTAGFLTVGELANVHNAGATDGFSQMDNGQVMIFSGAGVQRSYLLAVAPLVALGDWATVKGHTFTAYGVLTGQGEVAEVNRLAERFEMVFDRSNLLISDDPAERPDVIYKVREPLSEVNPN